MGTYLVKDSEAVISCTKVFKAKGHTKVSESFFARRCRFQRFCTKVLSCCFTSESHKGDFCFRATEVQVQESEASLVICD